MKRICRWLFAVTCVIFVYGSQAAIAETTVGAEIHARWLLHLNDHGMGKNFNYFNVSRGWVVVNHTFNEKYSATLIVESTPASATSSDGWQTRLRKAYLQANTVIPYTDVRFGMQNVLYLETVDRIWGLRYVDEVSLHKLGYVDQADLGVSAIGNCPGGYGILALQIVNGSGYRSSEANKYKDVILYGEFRPLPKNPDWNEVALVGNYYMGYPNIADGSNGQSFSENTMMDRMQIGTIIKYRTWFSIFAEYFVTKDDADWTNGTDKEFVSEASGFSTLGRLYVATSESWLSRVSVFGKYENIDKNKNAESSLIQDDGDARYLVAGISYEPTDNYELALVVHRNTINRIENNVRIAEDEENSFMFTMRAIIQ